MRTPVGLDWDDVLMDPRPFVPDTDFELARFCNLVIDEVGDGRCLGHVEIDPDRHANPNGVVHGAIIFALVDTTMGAATMDATDGAMCASIDVHVRFLRPASAGELRAETRVLKAGRRVVQLESTVTGNDGKVIASASGSFAVLGPPAA